MKRKVNLGMIGLGARGETLLATLFAFPEDEVSVSAVVSSPDKTTEE